MLGVNREEKELTRLYAKTFGDRLKQEEGKWNKAFLLAYIAGYRQIRDRFDATFTVAYRVSFGQNILYTHVRSLIIDIHRMTILEGTKCLGSALGEVAAYMECWLAAPYTNDELTPLQLRDLKFCFVDLNSELRKQGLDVPPEFVDSIWSRIKRKDLLPAQLEALKSLRNVFL